MKLFCLHTPVLNIVTPLLFMNMLQFVRNMESIMAKIVNGIPASITQYPYAARFFNQDYICGGTILNSWTILTAAHCLMHNKDVFYMIIGVGETYLKQYNGTDYGVLSCVIHDDYSRAIPFEADIALLFVEGPIVLGQNVQRAVIGTSLQWQDSNQNIVAIGWGFTQENGTLSTNGLLQTKLEFVPKTICEEENNLELSDDMFCLYGNGESDTCQGDSGSAVIWNKQVIGIVSHGSGCSRTGKPSMYISVQYYIAWIQKRFSMFVKNYCEHNFYKEYCH